MAMVTGMAMAQSIASLATSAAQLQQGPASSSLSISSLSLRSGLSSSQSHFTGSFGLSWSVQGSSNGGVAARSERQSFSSVVGVRAAVAEPKKVLIVNTNSGGHAVIGFWTAKDLVAAGHSVTVLTVGEEASDKMKKQPFSRFNVRVFLLFFRLYLLVAISLELSVLIAVSIWIGYGKAMDAYFF